MIVDVQVLIHRRQQPALNIVEGGVGVAGWHALTIRTVMWKMMYSVLRITYAARTSTHQAAADVRPDGVGCNGFVDAIAPRPLRDASQTARAHKASATDGVVRTPHRIAPPSHHQRIAPPAHHQCIASP